MTMIPPPPTESFAPSPVPPPPTETGALISDPTAVGVTSARLTEAGFIPAPPTEIAAVPAPVWTPAPEPVTDDTAGDDPYGDGDDDGSDFPAYLRPDAVIAPTAARAVIPAGSVVGYTANGAEHRFPVDIAALAKVAPRNWRFLQGADGEAVLVKLDQFVAFVAEAE